LKTYLIIGGSSGIGAALVANLEANNHQVIATFNAHPQTNTANVKYVHYNVLDTIPANFIPEQLDGLVYCPGAIVLKPFARFTQEDFLKDYQLQVTGAATIIQAALPALKKVDQASVVLFSTIAVQRGFNFHSMVAASKGAIEGITRALAAEFAPKIRFNCIAPSITDTPLASNLLNTPEKIEANAQRHPLKKIGNAGDIAKMAAFLLSDDSAWMTGEIIHLDGGMHSIK
jgi:NAD(P)-dependent dehydrogenase (short-subunit alcohol dehydrogenase family)